MKDTKDPTGPALVFERDAWADFLTFAITTVEV